MTISAKWNGRYMDCIKNTFSDFINRACDDKTSNFFFYKGFLGKNFFLCWASLISKRQALSSIKYNFQTFSYIQLYKSTILFWLVELILVGDRGMIIGVFFGVVCWIKPLQKP